ncbi:potassium-transporting ATPase subunit KdpC [Bdellovibrio sp. SKB1291214]|uniref:potassium-transporting ATPase subunit KdpC n=1 Tax=Bdellovibrio sp. SKB1291214 TaxID=1732569 RepID=UPI000B517F55|nr:potassium-transporting ATPase subunit KdpC [Bdellovibrio sp. SKB1291214]UYL08179.1 potassium-transporting ATPase subunit KdpC [Bdellovibrio sp. SKB1291214]
MKNWLIGFRLFVALSVLTGIAYPCFMTAVGSATFPEQTRGSLIKKNDAVVGSTLLAQKFTGASYFWPRPSAADYNGASSGASNMSPTNEILKKVVAERQAQGLTRENLYASGSGLDPEISPEAAKDQIERIAKERKLTSKQTALVSELVQEYTEGRQWGFMGEPRVNVLKLNLALDQKL